MNQKPRYFAVPASMSVYWGTVFEYAELMFGYSGNDFIGCRTMTSSTGKLVVKMATV